MKKFISVIAMMALLLSYSGCSKEENPVEISVDSQSSISKTGTASALEENNNLYAEAMRILNELNYDQRVDDFLEAYNLLMTLPNGEKEFIEQLSKVNAIFEKYHVEFDGGEYFLLPKGTIKITNEKIKEYCSKSAYYDAKDLLSAIVYPVLFDKYGDDAHQIKGLKAENVTSAIKSNMDYHLNEKKTVDKCTRERWDHVGYPKSFYEFTYHSNGLVKSIDIPIARSVNPFNDEDYKSFWDKEIEKQKLVANERFMEMSNQIDIDSLNSKILDHIYTEEEIRVIYNYIQCLTPDEIWKQDLLSFGNEGEITNYSNAIVCFDYKGNSISVHYGLNYIYLSLIGKNDINELSSRWNTLWCGLCLPA